MATDVKLEKVLLLNQMSPAFGKGTGYMRKPVPRRAGSPQIQSAKSPATEERIGDLCETDVGNIAPGVQRGPDACLLPFGKQKPAGAPRLTGA